MEAIYSVACKYRNIIFKLIILEDTITHQSVLQTSPVHIVVSKDISHF